MELNTKPKNNIDRYNYKIIGCGAVIKAFIKEILQMSIAVYLEIYVRDIKKYFTYEELPNIAFKNVKKLVTSTNDIIIIALSANESKIIQHNKSTSRDIVARENISLIRELLSSVNLDNGCIFVLTNPSELVAEYIYSNTNNKNIYSLGYYYDYVRYNNILRKYIHDIDRFELIGIHYLNPIISNNNFNYNEILLLEQRYIQQVTSEFTGYKPPIYSGVANLINLILSIANSNIILTSGYCKPYNAFLFGKLEIPRFEYKPNLPSSACVHDLLYDKLCLHYANQIKLGIKHEDHNCVSTSM